VTVVTLLRLVELSDVGGVVQSDNAAYCDRCHHSVSVCMSVCHTRAPC